MKLDLPIKWKDIQSFPEDEALTRRALNQDDQLIVYEPGFLTIDTNDIENWNEGDDDCTSIRTYSGLAYSVTIPYDEFKALWTQITGEAIVIIRVKEKKAKNLRKVLK